MLEMGQLFGLTAQQLGSKLKAMGLRDPDGQPSQVAQDAQLVGLTSKMVTLGRRRTIKRTQVLWHRARLYAMLTEAGMAVLGDLDDELFGLAARTNALLKRAQNRRREGDEGRGQWAHRVAERQIGEWMKPLNPVRQAEQAARLLSLLVNVFGWPHLVAEDVIKASVSREVVRRQALLEQSGRPQTPSGTAVLEEQARRM